MGGDELHRLVDGGSVSASFPSQRVKRLNLLLPWPPGAVGCQPRHAIFALCPDCCVFSGWRAYCEYLFATAWPSASSRVSRHSVVRPDWRGCGGSGYSLGGFSESPFVCRQDRILTADVDPATAFRERRPAIGHPSATGLGAGDYSHYFYLFWLSRQHPQHSELYARRCGQTKTRLCARQCHSRSEEHTSELQS